ncbi:hypothetical protein Pfo_031361 [Paulownia fortunei]|nr:hypothetical protein Pfo_031361 [Paulownia fortunei]
MANLPMFEQIIKHELVHYHLHLAHKGYRHKDTDFKVLLSQVGGARYAPDIGQRQATKHLALSMRNGHDIFRQRRFQVGRYRCGQCGARLMLLGEVLNKITHNEVAALGDSLNDASQIKAAGVGAAVANAKPEIKAIANLILDKTNNEGAVAEFYQHAFGGLNV